MIPNCYVLPQYVMAFRIPLSTNDKFKSHSALGKINDIVVVSKTLPKQHGIAIKSMM